MSAKALFQNEIKRSNDFEYWREVIAYWKNIKKSNSDHIEFKNQIKKKRVNETNFMKKKIYFSFDFFNTFVRKSFFVFKLFKIFDQKIQKIFES